MNYRWNKLLEMPPRSRHVQVVVQIRSTLNRTRAGLVECKLDLHFRASLYHPKLGWVSSDHRFAPNAGHMDSCMETRAQKGAYDIMRGVDRVVYLMQRLIDCHRCSSGSQSGGSGPWWGKHFEPIERIARCSQHREMWHIWIESGTRVVLALREASAIKEERQSGDKWHAIL